MKKVIRHDIGSARVEIEGIADLSLNQSETNIGIILLWKLKLIGFPILEGKKEHLESLMSSVLQYSRYRLSGVKKSFGLEGSFVSIKPNGLSHSLVLRSTKEGVEPLTLNLDDAELSDLTSCLDRIRSDKRICIKWNIPSYKGISRLEFITIRSLFISMTSPIIGFLAIALISFILLVIPAHDESTQIRNENDLTPISLDKEE